MLHLSTERLAALADDEPTATEAEHLHACSACAREREVYRSLATLARDERDRLSPPLTRWEALAGELRVAGLLRWSGAPSAANGRGARRSWLRAAAAVLLVSGGLVAGRLSAGAPVVPRLAAGAGEPSSMQQEQAPAFASRDEALRALTRASELYQQASAYLIAQESAPPAESAELYRTRLAALDEVAAATQRALNEAPYDPVINRYYLATMGARQATLQQLGTSMPAGVRLTGF